MGAALIQETKYAIGRVKQSAVQTANVLAELWRPASKLNPNLADVQLQTEDDSLWIGKGHEFAENNYQSAWNVAGQIDKIASAEFLGWAFAFALGKQSVAGAGPTYTHTLGPLDTVADGISLPCFSAIETIRQGANDVLDRLLIGNVIEDVTLTVSSGPSLQNCRIVVNFVGCGKQTVPSAIVIPDATAENILRAASLTFSAHAVNFVSTGQIISLELQVKNNVRLDSGFYPGCGFQTAADPTSGAIRGRMEHGTRTISFKFAARFQDGDLQLTKLTGQTTGTAVIGLTGGNSTSATITLQKTAYKSVKVDNTEGIVSAESELLPMMHATNGLIEVSSVNTLATILNPAA